MVKDNIDEDAVEKVVKVKAVALLPSEEEKKEIVIHIPEEEAKTAEIGVLSVLIILILIGVGIAVAYFIYDRKRQQKIKECMDKLQKTEEGEKNASPDKGEPSPPAPFSVSDPGTTPQVGLEEDQTPTLTPSETPPDSGTDGMSEDEGGHHSRNVTNNNRDRNVNAVRRQQQGKAYDKKDGRRCCMCFCCAPPRVEPTLEELWQQKKSKQKGHHNADVKRASQELTSGRGTGGSHHSRHQQHQQHKLYRHKNPRLKTPLLRRFSGSGHHHRKHNRSGSHRGRSQSQPVSSTPGKVMKSTFQNARQTWIADANRSCWKQVDLLKKRSLSLSPTTGARSRLHEDSQRRHHRHGVGHRSERQEVDCNKSSRHNALDSPRIPCPEIIKSSSRQYVDTNVGDHRRKSHVSDKAQDHQSKSGSGKYPSKHKKGFRYYVMSCEDEEDGGAAGGPVQRDQNQGPREKAHNQIHYLRGHTRDEKHPERLQDGDIRHSQSHIGKLRQHESCIKHADSQDHCNQERDDKHKNSSYQKLSHYHIHQSHLRQTAADAEKRRHYNKEQGQRYLQESQKPRRGMQSQENTGPRRRYSPQNYKCRGNVSESSTILGDSEFHDGHETADDRPQSHHAFRPIRATPDTLNQNQSAYWITSCSHSVPRLPPPPHPYQSKRYTPSRTIPKLDSPESSLHTEYERQAAAYHYHHRHLNVSQNYNWEDEVAPTQMNQNTSHSPVGRQSRKEDSENQNDELSDLEVRQVKKRKVCRKRASDQRLRRTSAKWMVSKPLNVDVPQEQACAMRYYSSSSSDCSQEGDEIVRLAHKLFGMKLISGKRTKRQQAGQAKRKKKNPRTEEDKPLLEGDASWGSDDTTCYESKETELADSGYDISASFPSDAHHPDLTSTPLSPLFPRKVTDGETSKIPPFDQGTVGGQRENNGKTAEKESSLMTFDPGVEESFGTMHGTKSNQTCTDVGRTKARICFQEKYAEPSATFRQLGDASSAGTNLLHLREISKDDQREFRKLATQRWCEQQQHLAVGLQEYSSHATSPPLNNQNSECEAQAPTTFQSSETNSPALVQPQRKTQLIAQQQDSMRHSSGRQVPDQMATKFARSPKGFRSYNSLRACMVEEDVANTVKMDCMDFTSSTVNNSTAAGFTQSKQTAEVDVLYSSDLEEPDMFAQLAKDRLQHSEQKSDLLASENCNDDSCSYEKFVKYREPQNTATYRSQNTGNISCTHNADNAATLVCSLGCLGLQGTVSTHPGRNCSTYTLPRSSPSEDQPEDRGHLSASILPSTFHTS